MQRLHYQTTTRLAAAHISRLLYADKEKCIWDSSSDISQQSISTTISQAKPSQKILFYKTPSFPDICPLLLALG